MLQRRIMCHSLRDDDIEMLLATSHEQRKVHNIFYFKLMAESAVVTTNEVEWCKRPGYPLIASPLRMTCDTDDVILSSKRCDR